MARRAPTYVGTLYAVQFVGDDDRTEVAETVIGVDDRDGIVQAWTRAELAGGDFISSPRSAPRRVETLWYRRSRQDFPGGSRWYHDLDNCLGRAQNNQDGPPLVVLAGPDVSRCEGPGDFLCG